MTVYQPNALIKALHGHLELIEFAASCPDLRTMWFGCNKITDISFLVCCLNIEMTPSARQAKDIAWAQARKIYNEIKDDACKTRRTITLTFDPISDALEAEICRNFNFRMDQAEQIYLDTLRDTYRDMFSFTEIETAATAFMEARK